MKPRRVLIHDDAHSRWLSLSSLSAEQSCHAESGLVALLDWAEQQSKTGLWVCGFMRYEAAHAFDEALQPMAADNSALPLGWFAAFEVATPIADPAIAAIAPVPAPVLEADMSPELYQQRFQQVKDYLGAGDTYQVNLTFRLRGAFDGDSYALFCQLCANQAGRFSAYLAFEHHVVMSVSPELFFERQGDEIQARPMKGTIRRGKDEQEDQEFAATLKADPKNQAENLMIVDMIRNDLGRVAEIGSVEVPKLFEIESYPRIQQMTTTVTARSSQSLSALMLGLFPCASITGAPKARTVEIIAELESSPRELYTGTIGLIQPGGDCQFSVVIRTAVWDRRSGELSFGAGSGVVWDSTGEDEHEECLLKANILDAQAQLGLIETIHWNRESGYRLIEGHKARLQRSAAALGISFDPKRFDSLMANQPSDATARIRVHLSAKGELSRIVAPAPVPMESMRVAFCPWPVESSWPLLQHKVDKRDVYQQAFADTQDCDQPLLWNEQRNVTEGTFANVVIREGARMITPPVSDGLLPGVMRDYLLQDDQLEEESISCERLLAADEVWLINSLRGWIRAVVLPEVIED